MAAVAVSAGLAAFGIRRRGNETLTLTFSVGKSAKQGTKTAWEEIVPDVGANPTKTTTASIRKA